MRVACVKRGGGGGGGGGGGVVGRRQPPLGSPNPPPPPLSSHCGVESLFPPAARSSRDGSTLLAREWSSRDAASRRRRGARARRGNGRGVLSHPTREGVVRHRRLAPADLVSSPPALLRHSCGTLAGPPARRVRPLARRRLRLRPPAADRGHAPRLVLALAADRLGARRGRRLLPRQHAAAHERRGARVAPRERERREETRVCVCARVSSRTTRCARRPPEERRGHVCVCARVQIAHVASPLANEERSRAACPQKRGH